MYKGPYNSILYLLALALLIVGAHWKVDFTVYLMAALFLVWDLGFILRKESFVELRTERILSHCRDAETLMSYFIGFYAVVFAVVFEKTEFLNAYNQANIPSWLVGAPLVLASIPMLFIPVQLGKAGAAAAPGVAGTADEITRSVKALLLVNIYFEKLVVFTFVHDVLRILTVLPILSPVKPSAG